MDPIQVDLLLRIATEAMKFPQLRVIHLEAIKQLTEIAASLAPAPAAAPALKRSIPTRGI